MAKYINARNIKGKSLRQFNHLTFEIIGLKDFEIVNYLVEKIEELRTTYKGDKINKTHMNTTTIIPEEYKCSKTRKIMKDPVMAFDGYCYEPYAVYIGSFGGYYGDKHYAACIDLDDGYYDDAFYFQHIGIFNGYCYDISYAECIGLHGDGTF